MSGRNENVKDERSSTVDNAMFLNHEKSNKNDY